MNLAPMTRRWSQCLLALFLFLESVEAVLQSLLLDVTLSDAPESSRHVTMLASQANFGHFPDMNPDKNPSLRLTISPKENALLCDNITTTTTSLYKDSIMMVPRGNCTFETKVWNAQNLGARAVLVYGTLASRYTLNTTAHVNDTDYEYTIKDIIYPGNKYDYDCNYGQAMIPAERLSFDPLPYNAAQNDPLLSGPNSLCMQHANDFGLQNCASKACLLTGNKSEEMMEACCAWDLPIWLYNDPKLDSTKVTIPSAYVTMEQATELFQYLQENNKVQVVLYARWKPWLNLSSILIWALGVFVAALAAYMTASDYRKLTRKLARRKQQARTERPRTTQQQPQQPAAPPEEILELTAIHALLFVVMASASLLILFYFKIYNVVKVFYAVGCSSAVSQVIFSPLVKRAMKVLLIRDVVVWRTETEDFGDITLHDVISLGLGFVLGIAWLIVAFCVRNPDDVAFFWITQDLFGACMCIMFLKVIRLNSIHVASILLIVAFFYDIFFVFITPLIFKGKSVMITVATSGGPPTADALWCEKYPDDPNCQGGNPLPMLLTIPRLFDYEGGASLLGLGDIVLPGLLISFAARLDAAKSLLGVLGGGNGVLSNHCPEERLFGTGCCSLCKGGYFVPLVIAYAVGLLMANTAVYLMQMGQPALLYLVPCCLGTMAYIGWRRHELRELWHGPKALRAADTVLYGQDYNPGSQHAPVPVEEGVEDVLAPVPSAADDTIGDLPLMEETRGQ